MPKNRGSNYKIGFFPGNWDLFHVGHLVAIKEAKQHCDFLLVGVKRNNDDSPHKNQPIMTAEERVEILKAVKYVDEVCIYENEKALYELDKLNFGVRFMGADHKGKEHHFIKAPVVYLKGDQSYHTSKIREKIWKEEQKKR